LANRFPNNPPENHTKNFNRNAFLYANKKSFVFMRKICVLFFILTSINLIVSAQQVMTPELLWRLGRVSIDDISADGSTTIYGITRYDLMENKGQRDLYLINTQTREPRLLLDLEKSASNAKFILNGSRIGFEMGGQYYSVKPDGSDLQQHTSIEGGIFAVKIHEVSAREFTLIFGKQIQVRPSVKDQYPGLKHADVRIIDDLMYRHWDSWKDENVNHLCLTKVTLNAPATDRFEDLQENSQFDTPQVPFGGSEDFDISPDGRFLVYSTKKLIGKEFATSTNTDIFLYDLEKRTEKNLSFDLPGYDQHPVFSPTGKWIAWSSMARDGFESDVNDIVLYELATGNRTHLLEAAGLYDTHTFQHMQWGPDDKTLFAQIPTQGTNQLVQIDIKSLKQGKEKIALKQITSGNHNFGSLAFGGKTFVVERQDMNHATELFLLNPDKKSTTPLTQVNKGIYEALNISKIEKRMVKTTDGKDMLVWVIFPPDFDPEKRYPALLYCQGGPQSQVSQFYSFRWNFQLMAASGYIVVAPNRRGLPGFGREWNEAISEDWGGQPMQDYLRAIDDVAAEPYVDENRLGAVGASYGGYSVYMLAGIHENRFKALVSHCGLFNMESWYGTTEELFFANWDIGGPYWEQPNHPSYTKFNPMKKVDQWTAPLLVIHGGKDFRVPENQGMEAFQAAQLRGIPSKFLYFPNEGHWVLKPQNGLIWHGEFFSWLYQWLN
jgi:dipeptidyl aminopeptidase/acylaminoacyl peptidase